MATTNSSILKLPEDLGAELPFLSVYKDGELVESMCLDGLESVVLGRHTNCDLMVTHPSVSRHHLEIQILHSSRELLLTDLDSIHGTWINGEQALPLVPVTAKEGDSIKLGASSRVYSVRWRPRPQQNSTSSGDYSDNSDSPKDCTKSKEQVPGSMGSIKTTKPSQVKSGNKLQPICSTECNNVHAVDQDKVEQFASPRSEMAVNSVDSGKEAYNLNEQRSLKLKLDYEALQGLETSLETLAKKGNAPMTRRSSAAWEESKQTVLLQEACIKRSNSSQSSSKKNEAIMQAEVKRAEEESGSSQEALNACEGRGKRVFEAEKENPPGGANPSLSTLWARRSRSNPPPNLLTSTNAACPTIPLLPLQENRTTYPVPSAPPMPLSYLVNNLFTSAPSFLPPAKTVMVDKSKADDGDRISDEFADEDAKENKHHSLLCHHERSPNRTHDDQMMKHIEVSDEYISDKENDRPGLGNGYKELKVINNKTYDEGISQERDDSATTDACRRPFQPLPLTAASGKPSSPAWCKDLSGEDKNITQMKKGPSPVQVQNLDLMLRNLKGTARSEPRRAWHIIVDTSCFLESNSFKSLRQLEGIREVRLIIPKIVISELDYKRRVRGSARKALNWIESCMVKLPSWIHVQSSSENLPVAVTPPVSPCSAPSIYGVHYESMMSPTNGDHVLNCALLFNSTVFSGQIALLTNDIALKIKAMAEGLICEAPSTFCESLLSPYSGRFLWTTSVAHGHGWTEKPFHIRNCSVLAPSVSCGDQSTKDAVISTVKAIAFRTNHAVEGLKRQCHIQAQGLKVALD